MQWPEGMPDRFWASYLNMHMYDVKSGRMSRMGIVPEISGGLESSIDNPRLYEQFCTLEAIESNPRRAVNRAIRISQQRRKSIAYAGNVNEIIVSFSGAPRAQKVPLCVRIFRDFQIVGKQ
jgi:hypothetical protein